MALVVLFYLVIRTATYMAIGAVLYMLLVGGALSLTNLLLWVYMLVWPAVLVFTVLAFIGVIGVSFFIAALLIVFMAGYYSKFKAWKTRRNHLKILRRARSQS